MNRRDFIFSAAALAAIPLLPVTPLQDKITWTEQWFDLGHQFAIAGEYKGRRKAARLPARGQFKVTIKDRIRLRQILTGWFEENVA
jgi:hypothetical protein